MLPIPHVYLECVSSAPTHPCLNCASSVLNKLLIVIIWVLTTDLWVLEASWMDSIGRFLNYRSSCCAILTIDSLLEIGASLRDKTWHRYFDRWYKHNEGCLTEIHRRISELQMVMLQKNRISNVRSLCLRCASYMPHLCRTHAILVTIHLLPLTGCFYSMANLRLSSTL